MSCTLLIPPEGLMELWNWNKSGRDVLTERGLGDAGVVQIHLSIDGSGAGVASWNIVVDQAVNPRGGAVIEYLCGAHMQVNGSLVVEGLDERDAIEIMRDVAN